MDYTDPVYKRMDRCIRHLEKLLEIASDEMNTAHATKRIDFRKQWELIALKEAN